ncbi:MULTISPECIES: PEP-CTERM sorting domain-containing protein [Cyanophyceae]|uniref:PEP-CTERM sorting domain-containing protein n=1 Tax=Cyanophyceae TaxID=3028117 RepID=UPI00135C5E80|nr:MULTISPECIES: PEP-CTERM sorting domain-containing protein [Cyanophyceae]NMG58549.1 PEP-CTERM sorting domain-containing protein [Geitlerinema sp. P-1104]
MKLLNSTTTTLCGIAVGLLAASAPAQAANLVWGTQSGNDCSGFFGTGFENCEVNGSPVIAKVDYEDDNIAEWETNSMFPTITGVEWTFDDDGAASGTWTYTKDDSADPDIRYWVAKGGNSFNLFYHIADDADASACMGANAFSSECLQQAIVSTTGEWFTPNTPGPVGNQAGLSHLTFYDTKNGEPNPIPEPATIFGLGAIALASRFLRRKSDDA